MNSVVYVKRLLRNYKTIFVVFPFIMFTLFVKISGNDLVYLNRVTHSHVSELSHSEINSLPEEKTVTQTSAKEVIGNDWVGYGLGGVWTSHTQCPNLTKYVTATLKAPTGNMKIYVHKAEDDIWVSGNIISHGIWEGDLVSLIIKYLETNEDCSFVDIGANVGVYALSAAILGRHVIAVEPYPPTYKLLCASIASMKAPSNIHLINNIISDTRTEMSFDYDGINQHNIGGTPVKPVGVNDTHVVESVLLDDILEVFPLDKVIMKIDVETHEAKVLKGASKFFDTVDVRVVLMEIAGKTDDERKFIINFMHYYKMTAYDPVLRGVKLGEQDLLSNKHRDILWIKSGTSY